MKIGKYTKGDFNDKGNVFTIRDVSPCLESAMGTGGNHVPTFVEIHSVGGGYNQEVMKYAKRKVRILFFTMVRR